MNFLSALSRIAVLLHGENKLMSRARGYLSESLPISVQVVAGLACPDFSTEELALWP